MENIFIFVLIAAIVLGIVQCTLAPSLTIWILFGGTAASGLLIPLLYFGVKNERNREKGHR